jgi:PAS domain S-box-containing protein
MSSYSHDAAQLHFAALVASSDDAIVSEDLTGIITSWNRGAERIFGYSEAEALGQSIRLIVPPDLYPNEEGVLRRIRAGESVEHYETVRIRKDGQRILVSLTVSPIKTAEGEIVGASRIAREITERKQLERDARHFAAIVESSHDAIVSKDLNGIVTSWNPAAEAVFGFSASEMVGHSIRRLIPGDRQQEEDQVLASVRRGERVDHYETIRRRKDGTLVPVSLTVSPIRNSAGVVIGASKIARDVTERKRAEDERQRLLRIAQEASQLKDEFLATLSHELRTPLNAILGYIRLMRSGLLSDEKQSQALDTVARNATSLTRIVEDVLDVSRIISGKVRLNVQLVELPDIVCGAVDSVRPAADAKGLRLEMIVDPQPGPVTGDPERLQQIMWNLLSNAVKFTERGGRVQVRLERVGSHVVVTVSDTGVGIPESFLPYVFDRFRQADAGISRARGGLGLGLAIARQLVELQGGQISVVSDGAGQGSTFRVALPLRIVHTGRPIDAREHRPAPTADGHVDVPQLQGIRILAVDDDGDALALLREILETTGATVTTADSGEHALESIEHMTPDMLVADLAMPQMNGFELIDRLRQSEHREIREMPAAALTAYARSEDRARALRSGFQIHLTKPIDPGELMAAVATLAKRTNGTE